MKIDILAIGIHPDDVELSASGTLLRQASLGYTFGLLDLSRGELGTRGNAALRSREALDAARILGAAFREQLDIPDGLFTYSPDNLKAIVRSLRTHQPRVVLCNAIDDRHPVHLLVVALLLFAICMRPFTALIALNPAFPVILPEVYLLAVVAVMVLLVLFEATNKTSALYSSP